MNYGKDGATICKQFEDGIQWVTTWQLFTCNSG